MIKATFTGYLLSDPKLVKATNRDSSDFVSFAVALNRRRRDEDQFATADVMTFKFTEHAMEWLKQGTKVLISGEFFPGFYEAKDGTVAKIDVVADSWESLTPRNDSQSDRGRHNEEPAPTANQHRGNGNRSSAPRPSNGGGYSNGGGSNGGGRSYSRGR